MESITRRYWGKIINAINFTLESGTSITMGQRNSGLIIRTLEDCTINGNLINLTAPRSHNEDLSEYHPTWMVSNGTGGNGGSGGIASVWDVNEGPGGGGASQTGRFYGGGYGGGGSRICLLYKNDIINNGTYNVSGGGGGYGGNYGASGGSGTRYIQSFAEYQQGLIPEPF